MSHLATYTTTFNNSELFLKALEKGRKQLGFDQVKMINLQSNQHYQIFLGNKKVLINFIWNNDSYEASVDLKNWSEKYSFESLLRKLYSFYLLEVIESQKENLSIKRVLKSTTSSQTTISLIK